MAQAADCVACVKVVTSEWFSVTGRKAKRSQSSIIRSIKAAPLLPNVKRKQQEDKEEEELASLKMKKQSPSQPHQQIDQLLTNRYSVLEGPVKDAFQLNSM